MQIRMRRPDEDLPFGANPPTIFKAMIEVETPQPCRLRACPIPIAERMIYGRESRNRDGIRTGAFFLAPSARREKANNPTPAKFHQNATPQREMHACWEISVMGLPRNGSGRCEFGPRESAGIFRFPREAMSVVANRHTRFQDRPD
jgi:hypothetical protein